MQFFEVFLIVVGAMLLALAAWLGKRRDEEEDRRAPRQIVSGLSGGNAVKLQTSLTELLNELHTLSRDMTVDLEQKLSELKELLQLADTKLEELSSANSRGRHMGNSPSRQRTDGDSLPKQPHPELQITVEDDDAPPPPPNRYQQIYRMADEGFRLDDIARHVQMGKGEIQLILSLRKKD
jgi:hypothetical protein